MSLSIIDSQSEKLCSPFLLDFVRSELAMHQSCSILVPTREQARQLLRDLAMHEGCSIGVNVETPLSYARGLWELMGDGRRLVSAPVRTVLMFRCLSALQEQGLSTSTDRGTSHFLGQLARHYLPWLGIDDSATLDMARASQSGLSTAEIDALQAIAAYKRQLLDYGYIEDSELYAELSAHTSLSTLPLPARILACGFTALPRTLRTFFEGLATSSGLLIVTRAGSGPAFARAERDLQVLIDTATKKGLTVERQLEAKAEPQERASELKQLLSSLFYQESACKSRGDVRLLLASGPLAEAELIASEINKLQNEGIHTIVLAAADPVRMWRELAPKLYHDQISVSAHISRAFFDIEGGRAIYEYLKTVSKLALLNESWPDPRESEVGSLIQLGSMDWWPPLSLSDFLLSPLSGVCAELAYELDREWRSNRLLTPQSVLKTLMSSNHGSPALEQATRELLKNHTARAISRLLWQFRQRCDSLDTLTMAEGDSILSVILKTSSHLKEIARPLEHHSPAQQLEDSLAELVRALEHTQIKMRPQLKSEAANTQVQIMSYADAASLEAASVDCLILSGATSEETPIGVGDELKESLLTRLNAELPQNRLAAAREQLRALVALPKKLLIAERCQFSSDSKPAYPSVMLTELLGAYGIDAQDNQATQSMLDKQLGEQDVATLISPQRQAPARLLSESRSFESKMSPGMSELVLVPPEGLAEFCDQKPLLSASQIESYLDCPCKWFSLRRLRLGDNDAGFSPLEMGTFAHRVLELTHAQLFEEALSREGLSQQDLLQDPTQRLKNSSLDFKDEYFLKHAHDVLDDSFVQHLHHQHLMKGKKPAYQALVAHSNYERYRLRELLADLSGLLDFEAKLFRGFEPRFFEWSFGRSHEQVEYAGVHLTGTVDRIDVDASGNAIIIDYKHKSASGFLGEYAWREKDAISSGFEQLPRRVQSLIYAQVVKRAFPDLNIVGAVYLATKEPYEISGVIQSDFLDRVAPYKVDTNDQERISASSDESFGQYGASGMPALLDSVEFAIALRLDDLKHGVVNPAPRDSRACEFCPVQNCPERRTS